MFERLDPRSPIPLYAQIADGVRLAVAAGDLRPDEALPSVRQLSAQLRVNPATVVQAYRELENDGFVITRHGAGTFVLEVGKDLRSRERRNAARRLVRDLMRDARRLGVSPEDLRDAIDHELNGGNR
ncbi:MAG TPA: GntR family transcriptional regulator [Gemmatimonadaceae bacterium]|nr:GntR family transcriptional regulator [Gemmatimonadaceae bacterium]